MVSVEFALAAPPGFLEDGVAPVAGGEAAGCSMGFNGGGLESTILGLSVDALKDPPSLLSGVFIFTFDFSAICSGGTGLDSGGLAVATSAVTLICSGGTGLDSGGVVLGLTVFFLGTTDGVAAALVGFFFLVFLPEKWSLMSRTTSASTKLAAEARLTPSFLR